MGDLSPRALAELVYGDLLVARCVALEVRMAAVADRLAELADRLAVAGEDGGS
jgi:hypothetical protein